MYYSPACPVCNLTRACESQPLLSEYARPPGLFVNAASNGESSLWDLWDPPPFSAAWLTKEVKPWYHVLLSIFMGGFFLIWNSIVFIPWFASIGTIFDALRKNETGGLETIIIAFAISSVFVAPGVAFPLGIGPIASAIAWLLPIWRFIETLRKNKDAIREASRRPGGGRDVVRQLSDPRSSARTIIPIVRGTPVPTIVGGAVCAEEVTIGTAPTDEPPVVVRAVPVA